MITKDKTWRIVEATAVPKLWAMMCAPLQPGPYKQSGERLGAWFIYQFESAAAASRFSFSAINTQCVSQHVKALTSLYGHWLQEEWALPLTVNCLHIAMLARYFRKAPTMVYYSMPPQYLKHPITQVQKAGHLLFERLNKGWVRRHRIISEGAIWGYIYNVPYLHSGGSHSLILHPIGTFFSSNWSWHYELHEDVLGFMWVALGANWRGLKLTLTTKPWISMGKQHMLAYIPNHLTVSLHFFCNGIWLLQEFHKKHRLIWWSGWPVVKILW
jgi:hypothetical protein